MGGNRRNFNMNSTYGLATEIERGDSSRYPLRHNFQTAGIDSSLYFSTAQDGGFLQSASTARGHTQGGNQASMGSFDHLGSTRLLTQQQHKGFRRPKPRLYHKGNESSEEEEGEQFTVNPAEDIPRNRLVEKLVRGLQSWIQSMVKRENFRLDIKQIEDPKWTPAPRECATMTPLGFNLYLIGGLNYDTCKEVVRGKILGDSLIWERVPYTSTETIQGRQLHTTVPYQDKLYTFGGCFMFNRKR